MDQCIPNKYTLVTLNKYSNKPIFRTIAHVSALWIQDQTWSVETHRIFKRWLSVRLPDTNCGHLIEHFPRLFRDHLFLFLELLAALAEYWLFSNTALILDHLSSIRTIDESIACKQTAALCRTASRPRGRSRGGSTDTVGTKVSKNTWATKWLHEQRRHKGIYWMVLAGDFLWQIVTRQTTALACIISYNTSDRWIAAYSFLLKLRRLGRRR